MLTDATSRPESGFVDKLCELINVCWISFLDMLVPKKETGKHVLQALRSEIMDVGENFDDSTGDKADLAILVELWS